MPGKRLLRETNKLRSLLVMTVGLGTLGGFAVIAQAHTLARLINGAFLGRKPLAALAPLLALFAAIVVARAAVAWVADGMAQRMSDRVRGQLRSRLVERLFTLGPTYLRGKRTGELVNVLTDGIESLDSYVAGYLPQMALSMTVPLLILLLVFPVDPLSGLVLLLTAPVIPVFMVLIGRLSEHVTQRRWGTLSWMSGHFLDVLQGLTTLKLLGRAQAQIVTVRSISDRFRIATMHVLRVAFLSSLVMELTATLSTAVVAVEIGVRLLSGTIAFQQALFVLMLAPEFYLPLRMLGARHHAAMAAKAATGSITAILDGPLPAASAMSTITEVCDMPTPTSWQSWETIAFENVSYAYAADEAGGADDEHAERVALANCTFAVRRGEHVALVGPSGAGKSTIAHLLLRFFEPMSGAITLDGFPLADIPADAWRGQIAWVPQMPYLFNTSVTENIRLARPEATAEDVVAAARVALAHDFIEGLPQGYETVLGERGTRLSGGQAQRIALARAFLRDASILLLDEATSYLDPTCEAAIQTSLERLARGKTLITITHRRPAPETADRVLVMRQGQMVEANVPLETELAVIGTGGAASASDSREGAA